MAPWYTHTQLILKWVSHGSKRTLASRMGWPSFIEQQQLFVCPQTLILVYFFELIFSRIQRNSLKTQTPFVTLQLILSKLSHILTKLNLFRKNCLLSQNHKPISQVYMELIIALSPMSQTT